MSPTSPPDSDSSADSSASSETEKISDHYWKQSLQVVVFILTVWGFLSLGCGILFRDLLDGMLPPVGGAPFGFWMAQQGAILGFLFLLFLYMLLMNRLDRQHGYQQDQEKR